MLFAIFNNCAYHVVHITIFLEKYEEYKKSLLKQEKDFLSVNSYVSDECESTTCSLQTVLLKEALKTYGRSKKQLSIDYQDCMLPCIRRQKPVSKFSDNSLKTILNHKLKL
ncbi:hypothetical protein D918_03070 [Trichuris suis]|nr:hypothetical protein D918_03070 [Trichuris suis]